MFRHMLSLSNVRECLKCQNVKWAEKKQKHLKETEKLEAQVAN